MTVEAWQLAAAGVSILGAGATAAKLYFSGLERQIRDVREQTSKDHAVLAERLRVAEHADASYKQELMHFNHRLEQNARESGALSAKLDSLGNNLASFMTAQAKWQGRMEERLDFKKEFFGRLGRRIEDNPENGK